MLVSFYKDKENMEVCRKLGSLCKDTHQRNFKGFRLIRSQAKMLEEGKPQEALICVNFKILSFHINHINNGKNVFVKTTQGKSQKVIYFFYKKKN